MNGSNIVQAVDGVQVSPWLAANNPAGVVSDTNRWDQLRYTGFCRACPLSPLLRRGI